MGEEYGASLMAITERGNGQEAGRVPSLDPKRGVTSVNLP